MLRGLILTAFLLSPVTALADNVGKIENSAGNAVVLHERQAQAAIAGTILQLNDIVRTEAGGLLRVTLADGSALLVGENTELRVALFDAEQQLALVEMLHGRIRAEVTPRTKPSGRFVVKTPTASVLALGTTVEVETETSRASLSGTVTAQQTNDLPTSRTAYTLLQLTTAVGNKIKPQRDEFSSSHIPFSPTGLVDIVPGTMTISNLSLYPDVDTTLVTALDHAVVTSNVNLGVPGNTFLLSGQTAAVQPDQLPQGTIVKDPLWFWGSYGKSDIRLNSTPSRSVMRDFGINGLPCQPGLVVNGLAAGGTTPNFHFKILGGGTSTGENALHATIWNDGPCPFYFFVPTGTVMHPKGFAERIITGFLLGGIPNLKDFQIVNEYGRFVRVAPAGAHGAGPAAPAGGEVTVPMRSYCLELHKLAPAPQTEYKFGDENDQKRLGIYGPVLARATQLWHSGQLDTTKGHGLDSIIQWSLWAKIEGMDQKKFMEAFLGLVHKNYEAKKMKWDKDVQKQIDASGQEMWKSVQKVLQ